MHQPELLPSDRKPRSTLRKRLLEAHKKLTAAYLKSHYLDELELLDPLSDLVHALLAHRTRYEDNDRAYEKLVSHFGKGEPGWRRVRDAPLGEILPLIEGVTWPEQKGPRIQAVLRKISELRGGKLSLDFLGAMSGDDARAWLEQLPGVGPKTSAIVVMYSSLKRPALVIDTHHYRVCARLGFYPAGTSVEDAERALMQLVPRDWKPGDFADHHLAMFHHGQECCYSCSPQCQRCVVLDLCPYGQARVASTKR